MIITLVGGGSTFTPGIVKSIALRREDLGVSWEKTDRTEALKAAVAG